MTQLKLPAQKTHNVGDGKTLKEVQQTYPATTSHQAQQPQPSEAAKLIADFEMANTCPVNAYKVCIQYTSFISIKAIGKLKRHNFYFKQLKLSLVYTNEIKL